MGTRSSSLLLAAALGLTAPSAQQPSPRDPDLSAPGVVSAAAAFKGKLTIEPRPDASEGRTWV
jgi:hypothetical protein